MAVQAQYPSNVLLLNSTKNGQQGHDYSLQPQSPGGFLHQSHMLFNNGGAADNYRKRGREPAGVAGQNLMMNQLLSPPPQLIDLTQLHNHQQNNGVSTGLRLSFASEQQQQRLQFQQLQQQGSQYSTLLSILSEGLSSQIKRQRDEIDQFLQSQGEQLRRTVAGKRQRHYRALLTTAEETVARRLREKEAEMERAARRNVELEARAAQLSAEAQVWHAKAKAQEATAASLQAQLQHAILCGSGGLGATEDGGAGGISRTGGAEGVAEDAESAYVDPERVTMSGPKCRGCGKRVASVVVLPCRHLCACKECEMELRACPVCLTVKNSTVEVYLS